VARLLGVRAPEHTSVVRRCIVVLVVAVAVALTSTLMIAGFLALLLLLAQVFQGSLHVTIANPTVSWPAVWIVIGAFLGTSALVVALARHRSGAESHDVEQDPNGTREEAASGQAGDGDADEAPQGSRRRFRFDARSVAPVAAEGAVYVGVALLMMWPVTVHLASRFAGWKDAQYYTWLNWSVGQMIRSGHIGLRLPGAVYPYGLDLRLVDGQLPTLIGGLWNAVAGPYLAQNLGLMTGTLLNLWAGRRIGALFSERREVRALTAIAFATAPSIAARLDVHFTLYYAFPAALLVEDAVRVARGDHPIRPIRLGLLLLVAYLCGIYVLVFGAIAYALIVVYSIRPLSAFPRALTRGAAGVAIALVLMSPFLWARIQHDRADAAEGLDTVLLKRTFIAEADALSIAAQPTTSTVELPGAERLSRSFRVNVAESTLFPGFLLLGGVAGLVCLRSPMRWPLLIAASGVWLFSLGSSLKVDGTFAFTAGGAPVAWLPYTALINVPGLGSLRSPNRASVAIAAVLAVPFAMSAAWLFERSSARRQRIALVLVAGIVMTTNLLIPIHEGTVPGDEDVHRALVEVAQLARPGDTILRVPADCDTGGMLFQVLHRTPEVSCGSSAAAISWSELGAYRESAPLAALRCNPARLGPVTTDFRSAVSFGAHDIAELRQSFGVRFFLIDLRRARSDRCSNVKPALSTLERYEHLGEDENLLVVDTGAFVAVGS
jgi:hypothetical protein